MTNTCCKRYIVIREMEIDDPKHLSKRSLFVVIHKKYNLLDVKNFD